MIHFVPSELTVLSDLGLRFFCMRDLTTKCCCGKTRNAASPTLFDRDEELVEGELFLRLLMDCPEVEEANDDPFGQGPGFDDFTVADYDIMPGDPFPFGPNARSASLRGGIKHREIANLFPGPTAAASLSRPLSPAVNSRGSPWTPSPSFSPFTP